MATKQKPSERERKLKAALAELSPQQRKFVQAYLADPDRNASAAYRTAYAAKTVKAQSVGAARVLARRGIQRVIEIADGEKDQQQATEILSMCDRIERELCRVAFSRASDVADWRDGKLVLKDSKGLSDEVLAAVASVGVRDTQHGVAQSFKMHDKLRALDMLARRAKFYPPEQIEHGGEVGAKHGLSPEFAEYMRAEVLGVGKQ